MTKSSHEEVNQRLEDKADQHGLSLDQLHERVKLLERPDHSDNVCAGTKSLLTELKGVRDEIKCFRDEMEASMEAFREQTKAHHDETKAYHDGTKESLRAFYDGKQLQAKLLAKAMVRHNDEKMELHKTEILEGIKEITSDCLRKYVHRVL
jgi:hypothetical protein